MSAMDVNELRRKRMRMFGPQPGDSEIPQFESSAPAESESLNQEKRGKNKSALGVANVDDGAEAPPERSLSAQALIENFTCNPRASHVTQSPTSPSATHRDPNLSNLPASSTTTPTTQPANMEFATEMQELATSVDAVQCIYCDDHDLRGRERIAQVFTQLLGRVNIHADGTATMNMRIRCQSCPSRTCWGCGEGDMPTPDESASSKPNVHCGGDLVALVWIVLCGFDDYVDRQRKIAAEERAQQALRQVKQGAGVGYQEADEGADEEAVISGSSEEEEDAKSVSSSEGEEASGGEDASATIETGPAAKVIAILASLLPGDEQLRKGTLGAVAVSRINGMLLRSEALQHLVECLRDSALADLAEHPAAFLLPLQLLHNLAASEHFAGVLHDDRMPTLNLLETSFPDPLFPSLAPSTPSIISAPAATCLGNLARQATALEQTTAASKGAVTGARSRRLQETSSRLLTLRALILSSAPGDATPPTPTPWQQTLAITSVPDAMLFASHAFAKDGNPTNPPKGRMRRLVHELTTLHTALPPGIFVRHGEARADLLKALIVGPAATPYEDALFEFDLACGPDYPAKPPKMKLRTTGVGTVVFNPNLYAGGKVCLSLLGTWDGPGWEAGTSTLLQLLVSVQAMVFVEEPFCNEPGFESEGGSDRSVAYSRALWKDVVKYGMVEWLEKNAVEAEEKKKREEKREEDAEEEGSETQSIWADVVRSHFEARKEAIIKNVGFRVEDIRDVHAADQKHSKKPGAGGFVGTGWGGRRLGEEGEEVEEGDVPANIEGDLLMKLKGALPLLKAAPPLEL